MRHLGRWVMVHSRTDHPDYRYVCTVHWTRFGAADLAMRMERGAHQAGMAEQTWRAERRRPGDEPGVYTVAADPAHPAHPAEDGQPPALPRTAVPPSPLSGGGAAPKSGQTAQSTTHCGRPGPCSGSTLHD